MVTYSKSVSETTEQSLILPSVLHQPEGIYQDNGNILLGYEQI